MDPNDLHAAPDAAADAEEALPVAGAPASQADQPVPRERRLSRRASWFAMGAVILALLLLWVVPELLDEHAEQSAEAALVGRPAPLHYTLKDMHGADVTLASFKGKVMIINFWATWCGPCEVEIPDLIALQNEYPDDLVVLGVSIDDTAEMLRPYAEERQINYPMLVGLDRQDVQDAYGPLFGIPVSVFIDRDGTIVRRHAGIYSREQLKQEIAPLL